jgi:hypothetical protein
MGLYRSDLEAAQPTGPHAATCRLGFGPLFLSVVASSQTLRFSRRGHGSSTTSIGLNLRMVRDTFTIDVKRGDRFLQADLSLLIRSVPSGSFPVCRLLGSCKCLSYHPLLSVPYRHERTGRLSPRRAGLLAVRRPRECSSETPTLPRPQ